MEEWNEEQTSAAAEFRYAAEKYITEPSAGTRYALEMAAVACQILGLNPSRITPDGYATPAPAEGE